MFTLDLGPEDLVPLCAHRRRRHGGVCDGMPELGMFVLFYYILHTSYFYVLLTTDTHNGIVDVRTTMWQPEQLLEPLIRPLGARAWWRRLMPIPFHRIM